VDKNLKEDRSSQKKRSMTGSGEEIPWEVQKGEVRREEVEAVGVRGNLKRTEMYQVKCCRDYGTGGP